MLVTVPPLASLGVLCFVQKRDAAAVRYQNLMRNSKAVGRMSEYSSDFACGPHPEDRWVIVTRHTSHVTRHTSHVTRHTSHVARHTSHVTRHTSHTHPSNRRVIVTCGYTGEGFKFGPVIGGTGAGVARHASHVTRHASPIPHPRRTHRRPRPRRASGACG